MKGIALYDTNFFKRKTDNDLIKESITRILLTSKGERLNNPEFGSNLQRFIFASPEFGEIEEEIRNSIARWEPRVSVNYVKVVRTDVHSISVYLSLFNKETTEDFSYEIILRT